MMRICSFFCMIGLSSAAAMAGDKNITPPLTAAAAQREPVINFSLLDYRGKYYELRRTDARVVVLYFVGI
ncbi:MAG TPA: hypothetical protein VGH32_06395, partial [Pirellulales bacterium]